jgi:phosphotransferase system enzyme I (PtsI)
MEILRGISVAPGVAIGEAVVLEAEDYPIPYRTVLATEVPRELASLASAFDTSIKDLTAQAKRLNAQLGHDAANVFEWHIGVLKDDKLRNSIETMVREERAAAAHAASMVMRKYQQRFMQMSDPLLVERVRDVQDIERRLLRNILGAAREDLAHLSRPVILVAHDLTPTRPRNSRRPRSPGSHWMPGRPPPTPPFCCAPGVGRG